MDRAGRWRPPQPSGQCSVNILPPSGRRCGQDGSGSLWCPLMTTPPYQQYPQGVSDKSKVVAGILGILLGSFGAGRFYTGHTKIAVAQLLVSLFTCFIGGIWGFIDGILILVNGGTDAQGRPLRD
ncbi:NINE protein [Micromonospora terminaliae]|uniref:NINE protein n=2 Tax=Micromonospora terminaliae TaxID=1914461 RepID=A0AAJ2ZL60_9ACTN|nr:TM2 domain-containing protein [Micromonospora terminaliae]QGL46593.1 NINE protein [Micromonospora terminaliae]